MERLVRGDIVVTPFPFSDLRSTLKRPALILANLEGKDAILCQITKIERKDENKIKLNPNNLKTGNLKLKSFIRPSKLFTLEKSLISYKLGSLKENKLSEVIETLIKIFNS
jgi:mRNA interferase MazF